MVGEEMGTEKEMSVMVGSEGESKGEEEGEVRRVEVGVRE